MRISFNYLPNIKKIFYIIFVLIQIAPFANVSAITPSQKQLFDEGIYYYNYNSGTCNQLTDYIGNGPAEGLAFPDVTSVPDLVTNIDNYIVNIRPNSPFVGMGNQFVAAGQKYNVNPALVVALAYKEEGLGTADNFTTKSSHDSFGTIGITGFNNDKYGFAIFDSFEASIDPVTKYVSDSFVLSTGAYYSINIYQMMTHYTPDGVEAATQLTLEVMHKILDPIVSNSNASTNIDQTLSDIQSNCGSSSSSDSSSSDSSSSGSGGVSYSGTANGFSLTGPNAMAHFYQGDPRWANKLYGSWTIKDNGCGITSVAMVVDTLKNLNYTPDYYATKYGGYDTQGGSSWSLFPAVAKDFGLNEENLGTNLASAADYIRTGGLVIISVKAGAFTTGGHLMVIRAIDASGNFYLANPGAWFNANSTETTGYSASYLINQGALYNLFGFKK